MENLEWQIGKIDNGFKVRVLISIETVQKIIDESKGMTNNEELILSSNLTENKIMDFYYQLKDFIEKYEISYSEPT